MSEEIKEINLTNVEYIKHLENAIKDLNEYNDNLQQENENLKLQLKGTTHCYDEVEHKELNDRISQAKDYIKRIPKKDKTYYFEILLDILKGFKK